MRRAAAMAVAAGILLSFLAGTAFAAPPVGVPPAVTGNRVFYWRDVAGNVVGISEKGQLVWLEMPAGKVHVGSGSVLSGYALDYYLDPGTPMTIYDLFDNAAGFDGVSFTANTAGGQTYPGRLIRTPLVVNAVVQSADGLVRLKNTWKWLPGTGALDWRQIWRNASTQTIQFFAPKVFVDVDVDAPPTGPAPLNNFGRAGSALVAWNDPADGAPPAHMVTLASRTTPSLTTVFAPSQPYAFGMPISLITGQIGGSPSVSVDGSFGMQLAEGTAPFLLAPGAKQVKKLSLSVR